MTITLNPILRAIKLLGEPTSSYKKTAEVQMDYRAFLQTTPMEAMAGDILRVGAQLKDASEKAAKEKPMQQLSLPGKDFARG